MGDKVALSFRGIKVTHTVVEILSAIDIIISKSAFLILGGES